MHFTVERKHCNGWELVVGAVQAEDAAQAVVRASSDPGLYRVGPIGATGLKEHFVVPEWGPPEPIEPGIE